MSQITINTKDGSCPSYVYRPTSDGPWPAVLVFMDGIGIRPAMLELGERLASHGYFVLLPDLYYRSGVGRRNSVRGSRCPHFLRRRGSGGDSKGVAMMETAEGRDAKDSGTLLRTGWW